MQVPKLLLFSPFQKGFVRAHTRKGKTVGPYFTKRQKKIGTVKHTKKTRVDYSEKDAQLKIKLLEEKKKHHNLHVEAAKELKEKVDSHKAKGHSTFKIGNKEHDISKVAKDLNNHIEHHSNEVKSHDNHISKIKDRYKTDREYFAKKKVVKTIVKKEKPNMHVDLSNLPKLEGVSEKQVSYANDIRDVVLNNDIIKVLDATKENYDKSIKEQRERLRSRGKSDSKSLLRKIEYQKTIDRYKNLLGRFKKETSASFFLDHHHSMLKVYRRSTMSERMQQMSDDWIKSENIKDAKSYIEYDLAMRDNPIMPMLSKL